jgi:hypothetical protein
MQMNASLLVFLALTAIAFRPLPAAALLSAGAAKVDITDTSVPVVNDRLYVKALVLKSGATVAAIITVDAVAIAEIGTIRNEYLATVRSRLQKELNIQPANVIVNASHCHGVVRSDVEQRTVEAAREAAQNMVPVMVSVGVGREDRIMENRRLRLKNGREIDVRRAYPLPPDDEVVGVGPVDPQIGILRLNKRDGQTLAVIFHFSVHPIQGVPNGGNTADLSGFAAQVIEENAGGVALFLQGTGGDINPAFYKDVDKPKNAEPLGAMLGLSVLRALKTMAGGQAAELKVINEKLALPRAQLAQRIQAMEAEQTRLLQSLKGTSINLKTFISLLVRHRLSDAYPSYYSYGYLNQRMLGREDYRALDAENRELMNQYMRNIYTMEELTRLQTNLSLLRKHQANNERAGSKSVDAEVVGLRVGDFVLITFPGELTVQIGLNIKKTSPHRFTFVSGYTNGYLYYTPTAEQLENVGGAQEDSDCLLAPEWQKLFESKVAEILNRL